MVMVRWAPVVIDRIAAVIHFAGAVDIWRGHSFLFLSPNKENCIEWKKNYTNFCIKVYGRKFKRNCDIDQLKVIDEIWL